MRQRLRDLRPSLDPARPLAYALALGCAFFLAGRVSVALISHDGRLAPVWMANAVALAALLRSDSRRWPGLILACVAGNLAMSLSAGNSLVASGCMAVGNGLEYGLGAVLLARLPGDRRRIDDPRALFNLAGVASAVGLLAAGFVAASLHLLQGDEPRLSFRVWALVHPLCLLLFTPCLMVVARGREELRERSASRRAIAAISAWVAD